MVLLSLVKMTTSRCSRNFFLLPSTKRILSTAATTSYDPMKLKPLPVSGNMTKVICTLGPSTCDQEKISELVANGMNIARINFSHSGDDYTYANNLMEMVKNAPGRQTKLSAGSYINNDSMPSNLRAVLVDTKGPEIRTMPLQGDAEVVTIYPGSVVEITTLDVSGDEVPSPEDVIRIQVDYKSIAQTVFVGSEIKLDDGLIALEVTNIDSDDTITCTALNGGPIKKNKGVNLPGTTIDLPALTEKDKKDLKWACQMQAEFVAASFIRTSDNVRSIIAYLNRCIAELEAEDNSTKYTRPSVISKIENKEGLDNFDEILEASEGIMIARGDLGVEIPYRKVFLAQKMMVEKCNKAGKPVIVATQMLDSMQRNPRPTRAEVTDVGTAVLDGADCVMLSGETAAGDYPIESLQAMVSVVGEADEISNTKGDIAVGTAKNLSHLEEELDAISMSAVKTAKDLNAKCIILITSTGRVARAVANKRPSVPILAFCTDAQVARKLQLHRSVCPLLLQTNLDPGLNTTRMSILRAEAVRTALELGMIAAGDRIVTVDRTAGKSHDTFDFSHNIKLSTVKDM